MVAFSGERTGACVLEEPAVTDPATNHDRLRVGYARVDITPPVGVPLADAPLGSVISGKGRFSSRLRDPLYARALHLSKGGAEATLVVGDLLLVTSRLHAAVAARAGVAPERVLVAATHTHSGPGGYWHAAGRVQRLVGEYQESIFERIVNGMAEAIRQARAKPSPARLSGATATVPGGSSNRRRLHGPVDPDLTLLRFETDEGAPIDLVSFGAHPVIGSERENGTISADFPGELCARLERRGARPLFFQGAVGGLSPLFPEFPMKLDEHLALVGDVLERGYERAERALHAVTAGAVVAQTLPVPLGDVQCRIFPGAGPLYGLAESALYPLKRWMLQMGEDGRRSEPQARLHLLRTGDVALLGTPCDLGVGVALALKQALREQGVKLPVVGSQCDGYVGYVHLPDDYAHVPEKGFRELAYYENAMSLGGWGLGEAFVGAVRGGGAADPPT